MTTDEKIEERIASSYANLSGKLKEAADYVVAHQLDVATRSLRSVSAASGLSPAAFSRLARSLDFDTYEALREICRKSIRAQQPSVSERARTLTSDPAGASDMLARHAAASAQNLDQLTNSVDARRLQNAVQILKDARQVVLFGAFSSTGIAEYMAYLAQYFSANWTLAGRMGAALASSLTDLGPPDAVLIITKTPYARRAVYAAKLAKEAGAQVVVITDSHSCPTNQFADITFIVPTESPQFVSSYVATLTLVEAMIAMLVAQSGDTATARIRRIEDQNRQLGEFWDD